MKLQLVLKTIADRFLQRNLDLIQSAWNDHPLLRGEISFREITVQAAASNFQTPHNMGYTPKDVIVTSATGLDGTPFTGTLTWNWDKFDATNLNLTTSGPVRLRVLVGVLS